MTDENYEKLNAIDELFRETQGLRIEVQELVRESQEFRRHLGDETAEQLQAINRDMREIIFGLMDKERRRFYKKSKYHTSLEEHATYMKKLDIDFREENAFMDISELIKKCIRLKKLNDLQQADDENHKFLLFFDRVVDKVLQGYIVQFVCFLITGESYGRYEGYWNKNAVNDIEDVGNNQEDNILLAINEVKNTITNTLCFFKQLNQPEPKESEILISPVTETELKIN